MIISYDNVYPTWAEYILKVCGLKLELFAGFYYLLWWEMKPRSGPWKGDQNWLSSCVLLCSGTTTTTITIILIIHKFLRSLRNSFIFAEIYQKLLVLFALKFHFKLVPLCTMQLYSSEGLHNTKFTNYQKSYYWVFNYWEQLLMEKQIFSSKLENWIFQNCRS